MAKYSFEFKMEVVQAYLNAEGGYRYLASKYNIPANWNIKAGNVLRNYILQL